MKITDREERWINYRGNVLSSRTAEETAENDIFDIELLPSIYPNSFRACNVHRYIEEWRKLGPDDEVSD